MINKKFATALPVLLISLFISCSGDLQINNDAPERPVDLIFNGNGARLDMDPSLEGISVGALVVMPYPSAIGVQKYFKHWNTRADGTGIAYAPFTPIYVEDTMRLYAVWGDTYSVLYYNGSQQMDISESGFNGPADAAFVSDVIPQRDPQDFLGWSTSPHKELADIFYLPGDPLYFVNSDIILYATFTKQQPDTSNVVEVRVFDKTVPYLDDLPVEKFIIGNTYTLPAGPAAETGYSFDGWIIRQGNSLSSMIWDNQTIMQPGQSITLTDKFYYLVPRFKGIYNITYDANGADSGTVPVSTETYGPGNFYPLDNTGNLARADFEFSGWNTKADFTGKQYTPVWAPNSSLGSDITLYAQWVKGFSLAPGQIDTYWSDITYGNGLFVATSYSDNRVMVSTDGVTWVKGSVPSGISGIMDVAFGNGIFVAVAKWGDMRIMTSHDGYNWVLRSSPLDEMYRTVVFGNGLFVVTPDADSDKYMTSAEGTSWTLRKKPAGWVRDLTFGNGTFFGITTRGLLTSSPDGINWQAKQITSQNVDMGSICAGGGTVVAGGYGTWTRVVSHDNGTTWNNTRAPVGGVCAFGSGRFIFIARPSSMYQVSTSTDGDNWVYHPAPLPNNWNHVYTDLTYGGGRFVGLVQSLDKNQPGIIYIDY